MTGEAPFPIVLSDVEDMLHNGETGRGMLMRDPPNMLLNIVFRGLRLGLPFIRGLLFISLPTLSFSDSLKLDWPLAQKSNDAMCLPELCAFWTCRRNQQQRAEIGRQPRMGIR